MITREQSSNGPSVSPSDGITSSLEVLDQMLPLSADSGFSQDVMLDMNKNVIKQKEKI